MYSIKNDRKKVIFWLMYVTYGMNVGNFCMGHLIVYFLCLTACNLNILDVIKALKASGITSSKEM